MGLGLSSTAEFTGVTDMESWPRTAAAALVAVLDPSMRRLVQQTDRERTSEVRLHPAEEPVRFALDATGAPSVSARTSSAGPGYHAFVVECLEAAARRAGVRWTWLDEDGEPGDETGYYDTRDEYALREAMMVWLTEVARLVVERDLRGAGLSLPLAADLTLDPAFVISPMGAWSKRWFQELLLADGPARDRAGRAFFPWWDGGRDARMWRNVGRVVGMHEVAWSAAATDAETRSQALAHFALKQARTMDPDISVPDRWLSDLVALTCNQVPLDAVPDPALQGFRRRPMRRQLAAGWSIDLPGWYHRTFEEGQPVFWHGPHTVHISVFSYTPDERGASAWLPPLERLNGPGRMGQVVRDDPDTPGHALIRDDPVDGMLVQGFIAGSGNVLLVTVLCDGEHELAWAEQVWRSVRPPA